MRKVLLIFNALIFTSATMFAEGGRYLNRPSTKEELITMLQTGNIMDPQNPSKQLLAEGMDLVTYSKHLAQQFNTFIGPSLGLKITTGEELIRYLGECTYETASWNVTKDASGKVTDSEIYSTGFVGQNFVPFPRSPYYERNEMVLKYQGKIWVLMDCGNPAQDKRKVVQQHITFAGDKNNTPASASGGQTFIFNVYGGQSVISESANVTIPTPTAQKSTATESQDFSRMIVMTSTTPSSSAVNYQQPVYQQPVYQQPVQQGCCPPDPLLMKYTKQNRDANIAGAVGSFVGPLLGATLGWGLNYAFPTHTNYFYGNGGVKPNPNPGTGGPSDWPNGPNTNGQYPGGPSSWPNGGW